MTVTDFHFYLLQIFSDLYVHANLQLFRSSWLVSFTRQAYGEWVCISVMLSNVRSCKVLSHNITYLVIATFVFYLFWKVLCTKRL